MRNYAGCEEWLLHDLEKLLYNFLVGVGRFATKRMILRLSAHVRE